MSELSQLSDQAEQLLQDPRTAGDPIALSQVIRWLDEAVMGVTPDHPSRVSRLSNLGLALQTRFGCTGALADLDRAVDIGTEVIALAAPDHPNRARYLSNLGGMLQSRFAHTGQLADVNRAVDLSEEAVAATPSEHPNRAGRLSNLGSALSMRFERTAAMADLDRAVVVGTEAVAVAGPDHPNRARYLSNLGGTLQTRFAHTGALTDLDRAIDLSEGAVAAAPTDHPDRPRCLSNLGAGLSMRYGRTGVLSDLDRAVEAGADALAVTPRNHPDHAMLLSNLGLTLWTRFGRTGMLADLDRAIDLGEECLTLTHLDHPNRAGRLSNVGNALLIRFGHSGVATDLDRAIDLGSMAVAAVAPEHPGQALYLSNLGDAFKARFERTHQVADRDEAISLYRESLHHATGTPIKRAHAGRSAAALAAGKSDWADAEADLLAVLELVSTLTDHSLGLQDRQYHLTQLQGLAADTVIATILRQSHDEDRRERAAAAWQRLEQARTILLTQVLETRHTVDELRITQPGLANEFDLLRRVLAENFGSASWEQSSMTSGGAAAHRITEQSMIERRKAAAARWPHMLAEIRQAPGFEDFARPPQMATLHSAAGDGVIVALIASDYGSGALLLTNTEVDYLHLPELTAEAARDNTTAFLAALSRPPDHSVDNSDISRVLGWLWDAVAGPVLTRLGLTALQDDAREPQTWPRLWWITTGPLSLLPVHAAGHHDDPAATRRAVLDRVVSSYAPSVRALEDVRRAARNPGRDVLAIGINQTADSKSPPLSQAEQEASAVARQLQATEGILLGAAATRHATRARLVEASWAHFSCHGWVDNDDPAKSFLGLYDGPLRASELFALRPTNPYLVYLSACTTAVGSLQLLDESIHLASVFQLAGYPHVIATLWRIKDLVAKKTSVALYRAIHPDADTWSAPPYALHSTQHRLRARYRRNPELWASHIHLGP